LAGDRRTAGGSIASAIAASGGRRRRALALSDGFFELSGSTGQQRRLSTALVWVRDQEQRHFERAVFSGGNERARLIS